MTKARLLSFVLCAPVVLGMGACTDKPATDDTDTCLGIACGTDDTPKDDPDTDVEDTEVPDTDVEDTEVPDTDVPDTDPGDTDTDTDPGDTDTAHTGSTGDTHTGDTTVDTDTDTDSGDTTIDTDPPKAGDLLFGDVVITEVMVTPSPDDCASDGQGQYIEIKNATDQLINLQDLIIRYGARQHRILTPVLVAPGAYVIGRPNLPACSGYPPSFVAAFTYASTIVFSSTGATSITLQTPSLITLDSVNFDLWQFGVAPERFTRGYSVHLTGGAEDASSNDLADSWCLADEIFTAVLPNKVSTFGTPGDQATGCTMVEPPNYHTGDTGDSDSDPVDTDNQVPPLKPGDLVINEVNLQPTGCPIPEDGRYIEVYNNSGRDIDMREVQLDWGTARNLYIGKQAGSSWLLAPGTYTSIQRASAAGCYSYGNRFTINNSLSATGKKVVLHTAGASPAVIDEVDMTGWTIPSGKAIGFDPDALLNTPFLNPVRGLWCPQIAYIDGGLRDHGTPNAANSSCALAGDTDTDPVPPEKAACLEQVARNPVNGLDADELCLDDIIITEVHLDPQDCAANRAQGQYIEMYNASGAVLHLGSGAGSGGLLLDVGTQLKRVVTPIGTSVTDVAPGQYFTVHPLQFAAYCHDFNKRFALDSTSVLYSPTVFRVQNGQYEIDAVDFTGWTFSPGVSRQLMPEIPLFNASTYNDDESLWCNDGPNLLPVGSFDRGTPNARNNCANDEVVPPDDTGQDAPTDPRNTADGLSPEELYEGELVISEVMLDPAGCAGGVTAKYLEVYNTTASTIHLDGLQIAVGGNTAGVVRKTGTDNDLGPGAYATIPMKSPYPFCFNKVPVQWKLQGATLDGSRVRLFNSKVDVIDAVDFTGWATSDGRSLQFDPTVNPDFYANNDQARWCEAGDRITGTLSDFGSPNARGSCRVGTGTGGGPTDAPLTLSELPRGVTTVLITEFMNKPTCADGRAEYVEIANVYPHAVDLFGLRLRIGTSSPAVVVNTHVIIAENGYATLARTNANRCYVKTPTASYNSGWDISETSTRIDISFLDPGGFPVELDSVSTQGWAGPDVRGQSMQLTPNNFNFLANNAEGVWCPTPTITQYALIPTNAVQNDWGTPGGPNDGCADVSYDSGEVPPETGGGVVVVPPDAPKPARAGDLVITEFMAQPGDCTPEARAEYIEVYNTTSGPLDLQFLTISDEEGQTSMQFQSVIASHAYAVLVNIREGQATQCYGLGTSSPPWYDGALLNNNGDQITLTNEAGVIIDAIDFNGFPSVFGRSWELGTGVALTDVANNTAANWCSATERIAGAIGDLGTPGLPNSCVPPSVTPVDSCPVDPSADIKGVGELVAGDLVITEIMANSAEPLRPNDPSAEWVEVYNASAEVINLRGLVLSNRFGLLASSTVTDDVYVGARKRAVLARYQTGGRAYVASADAFYPRPLFDNQGDIVEVKACGLTVDKVDFRTWPDERPGEALSLSGEFLTAATNDAPWAWCAAITPIPGAQNDLGTPGSANPRCASLIVDTAAPPPGPVDSDSEVDPGYPDTDTWTPSGTSLTLSQLTAADLVVSELMVDPLDCTDDAAEYIEIHNNRNAQVDLFGLRITTGSGTFTLSQHVIVGPKRYVLGVPGGVSNCYDLPADFVYTGLRLANATDTVVLASSTVTFDSVNTSVFPVRTTGASWNLDPAAFTSALNDLGANWCPSPDKVPGGLLDRGTPGFANTLCVTSFDTDLVPTDTFDTFTSLGGTPKDIDAVGVGELLITEIMTDPRDCSDESAEYVEIYNNGAEAIDLNGLQVSDGTRIYSVTALPGHLVIEPGDYFLARRSAVNECYTLKTKFRYSSLLFGTGSDVAFIANHDRVIDLVDFGNFEPVPGHAYTLSPAKVAALPPSASLGDLSANVVGTGTYSNVYLHNKVADWCTGYFLFSGSTGDKGSPGKANDVCLAPGQLPPYPPGYIATINEIEADQFAITEFMPDPGACPDIYGEYVELRNNSPYAVDLYGMHVRTGLADVTVPSHVVVEPDAYALLRKAGGGSSCYFGVSADAVATFVMPNDGDTLELANVHSVLDRVDYSLFTVQTGKAFSVAPGAEDAVLNDTEGNWCFQGSTIAGTVDVGTPGAPNGSCASPAYVRNLASVAPGELVISEIMLTPADCYLQGENYLEITNKTTDPVDLLGLRVVLQGGGGLGGSSFTVDRSTVAPAGGRAVLTHFDPTINCLTGHVDSDYDWNFPALAYLGEPILLDAGPDTVPFDAVNTTSWTLNWTQASDGMAFQLRPDRIDATSNDTLDNWCNARVRIRGTVTGGTPGEPNDCVTDNITGPPLDTATDTDLPPVEDTDLSRMALVSGRALVSPRALWSGTVDRRVQVTTAGQDAALLGPSAIISSTCFYQYNVRQVKVLSTTTLCPNCEFGFEVQMDTRSDKLWTVFPGEVSDLAACDSVFASLGGTPQRLPNRKFYYSSLYGGLFYEDATGALVQYADSAEWDSSHIAYRKYVYLLPY